MISADHRTRKSNNPNYPGNGGHDEGQYGHPKEQDHSSYDQRHAQYGPLRFRSSRARYISPLIIPLYRAGDVRGAEILNHIVTHMDGAQASASFRHGAAWPLVHATSRGRSSQTADECPACITSAARFSWPSALAFSRCTAAIVQRQRAVAESGTELMRARMCPRVRSHSQRAPYEEEARRLE